MRKNLVLFVAFLYLFLLSPLVGRSFAVVDPLSTLNNKVGIHILFPAELPDAAKLINSNGGDWGYVTIPIQSGDRDLIKWQGFMDDCKKLHIIPLVRLASEGDYFNTKVWRKPTETDVLDFANFLSSLSWPTKNKYVIVFNEVNRGDEWGGSPDPKEYATVLSYAVTVFKSKSQDYFIISSGFDNASANVAGESIDEFTYMTQMNDAVPGIFYQIDGLGSHSYPNPGFAQSTTKQDSMSIASYRYQIALAQRLGSKTLPVFITETGWSSDAVSPFVESLYYQTAFASVWSDQNVIAVTPFLLKATGPFSIFSFIDESNNPTLSYKAVAALPKIKGNPVIETKVLGAEIKRDITLPEKDFSEQDIENNPTVPSSVKVLSKWLLHMSL